MPIFGGGKSTTTQQTTALPASAEEQRLRDANLRVGQQQTEGYGDLLNTTTGQLGQPDQDLLGLATSGLAQAMANGGISLSPEQRQALDQIFNTEADTFQTRMRRAGLDAAAGRGLALSDSPVANPFFQQTAQGLAQLGASRATNLLNFGQQGFQNLLGLKQFQDNLRQQAFLNRAGLLMGQPGSMGLQNNLFAERLAQGRTQTTTRSRSFQFDPLKDISQIAGMAGGAMAGFGGGVPSFAGSPLGVPMGSGMVSTPPVY